MSESQELQEAIWRRKLTPEEEARLQALLAAQPVEQRAWEQEIALTDHLRQLPDAPLSSNFTAQVMQALDSELARQERERQASSHWLFWFRRWAPRLAPVTLALIVGAFSLQKYQEHTRDQMVRSVATVFSNPDVLSPEVVDDFEVIRHLPSVTDEDLLVALQ
jgi:anti-sigma factor RsiW